MWLKTTSDWIDSSEPQLGKLIETELMYEIEEIAEAVIDYGIENGGEYPDELTFIDTYTEEEITIIVSEYI